MSDLTILGFSLTDMAILGGSLVVVLVAVWGMRKIYYARPHKFTAHDGRKWTWNPDGSYLNPDGLPVRDEETVALLDEAWVELHRRTARQTTAIHSMRIGGSRLGGD
jgi:hypothetical protein